MGRRRTVHTLARWVAAGERSPIWDAGLIDDRTVWVEVADTITPVSEHRSLYDELYDIYKQLYPATKEMSHRLAAIQTEQGLVAEDEPVPDAL